MSDTSLSHHVFSDCLWLRCSARGSFVNSPALKTLAEHYLAEGGNSIVVDLELCPGVDSTFMGTLAGLARRCMGMGGAMQIASPTARAKEAMESLGLDMLMEIDPPHAFWAEDIDDRRAALAADTQSVSPTETEPLSEIARTRHVLEAHNTLRSMNRQNDETFGYVCETLEEDLMRQTEEADEES